MLVDNEDLLATQLRQKRGEMNGKGGRSCPSSYSQESQDIARLGGAGYGPTAPQAQERIAELITIDRTPEILGKARTHGIQDKIGIRLGGERYQQNTFPEQLLQRSGRFHGQFPIAVGIDNAQTTFGRLHRFQEIDIPITRQVVRHIAGERCSQQLCRQPGDDADGWGIQAYRDQRDSRGLLGLGLCDLWAHHIAYALGASWLDFRTACAASNHGCGPPRESTRLWTGSFLALHRAAATAAVRTVGSRSDG